MASSPLQTRQRELDGKWIVAGMFAFAIMLTGALWVYWKLHTAPFLPLQQAIAEKFPNSAPRVEGGRRKSHEDTPRILRVTMKVAFDPVEKGRRARELARRLAAFVPEHYEVSNYDLLRIHLFWPEPEREIKQRTFEIPIAELRTPTNR